MKPAMRAILAPAKVNLCLHVGARRTDGFHELSSLAVFPAFGDQLELSASDTLSLTVNGPFAGALADMPQTDNFVLKAVDLLQRETGCRAGAAIRLQKNLPVASGIGGGTADGAAVLCGLNDFWGLNLGEEVLHRLAAGLGSDGPLCLAAHLYPGRLIMAGGTGGIITPGPHLPQSHLCLVNPLIEVPTGPVFAQLAAQGGGGGSDLSLPGDISLEEIFAATRNDLQDPAISLCPEIATVLAFIAAQPGVIASRMSGSGASCFALMQDSQSARLLVEQAHLQGWWGAATALGGD